MPEQSETRYCKNIGPLTADECTRLRSKRVCVVGCGGLGGYIIEMLGRLGIGAITAVDGDVFSITNLNRQLLSTEENMGTYKAIAACERMKLVNSDVETCPVVEFLHEANGGILGGHDLAIDALDNIPARKLLQNHCESQGIPLIHGAVNGWYAQISTIMPGDRTFDSIYPENSLRTGRPSANISYMPPLAASIQVAEAVKVLIGRGETLRHKLLIVDMINMRFETIAVR